MTAREQAAFAAGIETARQMALTAAVTIEVRNDAGEVRHRAAVAALQGLAEGLQTLMQPPATNEPLRSVFAVIAADPADSGPSSAQRARARSGGGATASTVI